MDKEIINQFILYLPKLVSAVILGLLGIFLVRFVNKYINRILKKSKIDVTIRTFLKSLVKIILYVILVIVFLSQLGVDTNSLLAILGVVGVAISLAIKDSLSNLAGGVLILFSKPFSIGDYIEFEGDSGTVKSITILYTIINTIDNKTIFIPNGKISNYTVVNYSIEGKRRLDLVFGISYENDFRKAKEILYGILLNSNLTLKDPEPIVNVTEFGDSSINIAVRVWVKCDDYINLNFEIHEKVKQLFDEHGISIPYNRLDINFIRKDI